YERNLATVTRLGLDRDVALAQAARAMRGPSDGACDQMRSVLDLAQSEAESELDFLSLRTALRFEGYLRRQERAVERRRALDGLRMPAAFSCEGVPGLSREVRQRLDEVRPETVGQAERIPGITPAAVAILAALVNRAGA